MKYTLGSLASMLHGTVVHGGELPIVGLAALHEGGREQLCPLFRKSAVCESGKIGCCVLTSPGLEAFAVAGGAPGVIVHPAAPLALAELIDLFHPQSDEGGFIHSSAVVHGSAAIHRTAWIGPGVVVEEEVVIGEGCRIGPNAVICRGSVLGKYVRVGPGAVVGHEGFGFVPTPDGPRPVRQVGTVVLEDFVELGACTCVDRGTLGKTVIGVGSKLDNLVQIGHNAMVGRGVIIAAQTGLAGSTRIGDGAMLGGQVGVGDHRVIGRGAKVAGQSGVTRNVPDGMQVEGTPALSRVRWLRMIAGLLQGEGKQATNIGNDGTQTRTK